MTKDRFSGFSMGFKNNAFLHYVFYYEEQISIPDDQGPVFRIFMGFKSNTFLYYVLYYEAQFSVPDDQTVFRDFHGLQKQRISLLRPVL